MTASLSFISWAQALDEIARTNGQYNVILENGKAVTALLSSADRLQVLYSIDGKHKIVAVKEKDNPQVIRIGMVTYVFRLRDKSYLTLG